MFPIRNGKNKLKGGLSKNMQIENFKDVMGQGSIMATFDLYLPEFGNMTIHNCKVVRSKKGKLFPSLHNYAILESNGHTKFYPVITFPLEQQEAFNKALYEALEPYITNR